MPVLAGIIPIHADDRLNVLPGAPTANASLSGADRMADVGPHLAARMRGRQRINSHVQGCPGFQRNRLPVNPIRDRYLAHPKGVADQRREMRHRAASRSSEDCA